jgi:hypothetical protein
MADLRDAARQALEALEAMAEGAEDECGEPTCNDCKAWRPAWAAITALKATLEQPEQPEQAWLTGCPSCGMDGGCDCDDGTYNPPRREWRGLSEEEVFHVENNVPDSAISDRQWTVYFARAIEQALRSKNHD